VLKRMGFFGEFYPESTSLPTVRESRNSTGIDDEDRIVEYLRAGSLMTGVMEGMLDVVSGAAFLEGSGCSSFLTDGVWLWRQDYPYYVETYHVPVPADFVQHVIDSGFECRALSDDELAELAEAEKRALGVDWWAIPGPDWTGSSLGAGDTAGGG
jgi:hypothetical protein